MLFCHFRIGYKGIILIDAFKGFSYREEEVSYYQLKFFCLPDKML